VGQHPVGHLALERVEAPLLVGVAVLGPREVDDSSVTKPSRTVSVALRSR
jgi:hypothetical protein